MGGEKNGGGRTEECCVEKTPEIDEMYDILTKRSDGNFRYCSPTAVFRSSICSSEAVS